LKDLKGWFCFLLAFLGSGFGAIKPTVFIVNKLFPEEPPGKVVILIVLLVVFSVFYFVSLNILLKLTKWRPF
jgi:hypothetical protein